MTLLLSNILTSDHNFDLPLSKCQLVYAILTQVSIHVAQLISDAIYQFAGIAPPRNLVDLEKSNRALGFPALITGLYQLYGCRLRSSRGRTISSSQTHMHRRHLYNSHHL